MGGKDLKPVETYEFGKVTVSMYDDMVCPKEEVPEMLKRIGKINSDSKDKRASA